jgi:plasmid stabilization system protein ParE
MAQRQVIWSHRARIRLYEILEYFAERNKSRTYSVMLFQRFSKQLKLAAEQPNLGIRTEEDNVRGLIVGDYILFYEATTDRIIVHTVWDSRQDPEKLKIK